LEFAHQPENRSFDGGSLIIVDRVGNRRPRRSQKRIELHDDRSRSHQNNTQNNDDFSTHFPLIANVTVARQAKT
jgi:hypothetical protein